MSGRGITVPEVFRALGFEPVPEATWAVGAAVREAWRAETGALPPKALRPKTGGGGSHCFAVYPPDWQPRIAEFVRAHASAAAAQGKLF